MNEVAGLLMKNAPFSSDWGYAWDTVQLCDYEEQKTTSVSISYSNSWSLEEDIALVKFLCEEEKIRILKLPPELFLQAAQFIQRCCPNKKVRRKFAIQGRLQLLRKQWKDTKVEEILRQLQTKNALFSTPVRGDEQPIVTPSPNIHKTPVNTETKKRKRGRPPKEKNTLFSTPVRIDEQTIVTPSPNIHKTPVNTETNKRKRGRPPKEKNTASPPSKKPKTTKAEEKSKTEETPQQARGKMTNLDDLLEAEYIHEGDTVETSFSKNNVQAVIAKNNGTVCFKWNEEYYQTPGKFINDVAKSIGLKGGRNDKLVPIPGHHLECVVT